MDNVVGVVLAAGHGSVALVPQSKLVEKVVGEPMVRFPVRLFRDHLGLRTVVVTNNRFGQQVRSVLDDHPAKWFAHQETRTGTAGAVQAAFETIDAIAPDCKHLAILYGDMPLWQSTSIARLIQGHLESSAVVTLFRIDLTGEHSQGVESFGRILYDSAGNMIAVREPYQMTTEELALAHYVNPSAWVFDLAWLRQHVSELPEHDRGDGFAFERWLPDLVPIAYAQGKNVLQLDLPDAREALGVNTITELEVVQQYLGDASASQQEKSHAH